MLTRALASALLLFHTLDAASPAEYRQKVGVYVWGKLGGTLPDAVNDIKRLGADGVVRIYIGPTWNPSGKDDHSPLDVKVRRADYRAFLATFPVVVLTAYDSASFERYKWGHLDAEHLAATKDEFRRFALELARTPGRKIVSNWEFENDCHADQWEACAEYYQARLDGIQQARQQAKTLGYPGEILTAFEFLILPGYIGRRSGLVEVGPGLKGVDFWSYSSWASIGSNYDAPTMYNSFTWCVHLLRELAAQKKLTPRLIIGEFGEYWDLHPAAERMKAVVDASLASGVEYLFDWVLYDQPGNKDDHGRDASHFGKYDLTRTLTPQGEAFRSWFPTPGRISPAKAISKAARN
jgi:hypothetical protein